MDGLSINGRAGNEAGVLRTDFRAGDVRWNVSLAFVTFVRNQPYGFNHHDRGLLVVCDRGVQRLLCTLAARHAGGRAHSITRDISRENSISEMVDTEILVRQNGLRMPNATKHAVSIGICCIASAGLAWAQSGDEIGAPLS